MIEIAPDTNMKTIRVVGAYNSNVHSATNPRYASGVNALTVGTNNQIDTAGSHEIWGTSAPGFVVNYSYPTYMVQCGGGAGTAYYFGLQVTYADGGDQVRHRVWRCTPISARPVAHASHAELQADSSNRYIQPSVVKLSLANRATSDPQTGATWLNYIDPNSVGTGTGKIGTKIAGEHFIIGVDTESSATGTGATITVAATTGCHTTGSGSNVHASTALNALTKSIAKYAAGTNWPTTYEAETLRVPTSATPGQKYYSCLTFDTPTASYTTVEVEVTRPRFW